MSHRLNNAIGGHLHRLQALAQMAKGLVMVACHRRSAAQKAGQLSHGQGPVDQVAPGLLVARDMAVQVAAEGHIQQRIVSAFAQVRQVFPQCRRRRGAADRRTERSQQR